MEICKSRLKEFKTEVEVCGTPRDMWIHAYYVVNGLRKPVKYCKECKNLHGKKRKCLKCNDKFQISCGAKFLCKTCYMANKRKLDEGTYGNVVGKE
jgi:hypothetical protein